jgi:adenylate cyclase
LVKAQNSGYGKKLVTIVREHLSNAVVGGLILMLTGFTPEHWFVAAIEAVHLPSDALKSWPFGLDPRILLVLFGMAIIVADQLLRRRAARSDEQFEGTGHSVAASPQTAASPQPQPSTPALGLSDTPSIAVLPFQNMSGDPEQEYFVDGMVEDLITALSRIRWLFVIARNSSFTYKGRVVNVANVGRELGVRYVLEGSVRRAGNRVRITSQLVEAQTGAHIWADRYDRDLADIFTVQDEVVRQVVAAIEPNLEAREILRARAKPTEKLDAYELYLRARPLMIPFTQDALRNAARLLQEAINIDPDYSDAWAALAICRLHLTFGEWDNDVNRGYADALTAAQRSVAADTGNGHSLAYAARVLAASGGNIEEAVDFANRALHLHPNSAEVQTQCGWVFVVDGNSDKALECFATARNLNPVDPYWFQTFNGTAAAYIVARRFEDAIHWSGRVLASRPDDPVALRFHAIALTHLGRSADASSAIAHMLTVQPNYRVSRTRWSFRTDAARQLFTEAMIQAGAPP